jgi:dihydrofolate reductase
MGKIVVSQNVSLDGVVEDPTGEEGFKHGGWFDQLLAADAAAWAEVEYEEALGATALLLGRRTDEYFGSRWNGRDGAWAERLSSLPKYVVSATIDKPVWVNGMVLNGDVVDEVARLKREIDGEIIVYGSRPLVRTLMEHGLVDELRLTVFPVVLGAGERLFGETADKVLLRPLRFRNVGDRLTHLTYEVVRNS